MKYYITMNPNGINFNAETFIFYSLYAIFICKMSLRPYKIQLCRYSSWYKMNQSSKDFNLLKMILNILLLRRVLNYCMWQGFNWPSTAFAVWLSIKIKTYLSFLSNVAVTLETIDSSKYGEFVRKLDEYQQATGINETTRDQIWSKTIQNGKLLEYNRGWIGDHF